MAKKPRSSRVDYAVYLLVRLAVCFLQALPERWAFGFAGLLARAGYTFDRRHRRVARENLEHAFPELRDNPAKRDRLVLDTYRHFATLLVEIILLPRKFHLTNWRRLVELRNEERDLVGGLIADRPLLIATMHFGNWEMAGYLLGLIGVRSFAIARVLDNPYLEAFLKRFRQKTGQTILAKKGDFDEIQAVLGSNKVLATLADQDAGPRGLFVDFFNRPASTHKAVALMALQYRAPMVVVGVPRIAGPLRYRIVVEDVIHPEEYERNPGAARIITERYTAALERIIRRYPEQYFWLHRRWKHQPQPKGAKKAA